MYKGIYLDNSATTMLKPEVLEAMMPYLTENYGNPSSVYALGRTSKLAIEEARGQVARAIGAQPQEIYFTGCGSEADNWAIKGAAHARRSKGNHIISTAIEHHAVLHTLASLEKEGFRVTYLPVDEYGCVTAAQVEEAITDDTILITIMMANNEIGTIEPIADIGKVAKAHKIAFHTDAVQTIGAVPVDVEALGVDMLSLSAHKFGGPKGVGALYIRKGTNIETFMHGGAQERNRRAGTENVPGIVGLGKAIELATADIEGKNARIREMRDWLIREIPKRIPDVRLNGHPENRLPGNVNFCFRYIEGEALLLMLDLKGVAGSSGSACTSGSLDPSHVLLAIGLPHEIAHGSLRLSIGEYNTMEEMQKTLDILADVVTRLREMSPLYTA